MLLGLGTNCLNALLNYLLIFGKLGLPALGVRGAAVATVIPPFVIIALVSYFYQLFRDNAVVSRVLAGMQAGVGAVIASVVWDMGADIARQKSVSSMLIMAAAFVLSCVCKVNVVYIVLGCIALGTARTLLGRRKAG